MSKRHLSPLEPNHLIRYKDIELLRSFITEQGKILPRRTTHLTVKQQNQLARAVKRARMAKLLPYIIQNED
jgi:small subunit ribosomal protein S18|uniref:Small ribosomal subunit protein bS18c n=2 Tax=Heterosigma akashiwo TaxID=2829 RepID=B2XT83_HETAK|nr:30S ribosomal protein S18 [Heterosigma akashiwo]ABV65981.1 30S ribosomal protein S18 [Heterosigma akashiwo]ABV70122.1 30S ribosomal protein S18 [Heterosigma akashiwo]BBA18189.1 30S ribosomal protein S1 [Heterosigma akashiwo]BBA18328.1 30S ribosomal protein S1 [Heterosigma akashiwo]BBA18467.1 30S ribosomal protein S1 [Heterosigma akashiwo]